MSDKRAMATDALETLGTIIDDTQKRDAIHLAVIPAVAGQRLEAGWHVTMVDGIASTADEGDEDPPLGIVDPFLKRPVKKGEHFWLVIYPRTIKSLRHVWAHPAFPDEPTATVTVTHEDRSDEVPAAIAGLRKLQSEKWLRDFCSRSNCPSYEVVIGVVAGGDSGSWDDEYLHFNGSDAHGDIPDEFWMHAEVVLGRKLEQRAKYFSCSC